MKNSRLTPRRGLDFVSNGRLLWGVLPLLCFLVLSSQSVKAQVAFGSMVGNVTDASGGAITTAAVKITLTTTNDTRVVLTDSAGAYTITTVRPGTYRVEITRDGFRTFVASNILVTCRPIPRPP